MQQHYYNAPQMPPESEERKPVRRRRHRLARFFRGYLMTVGAAATLYGLWLLLVWALDRLGAYMLVK